MEPPSPTAPAGKWKTQPATSSSCLATTGQPMSALVRPPSPAGSAASPASPRPSSAPTRGRGGRGAAASAPWRPGRTGPRRTAKPPGRGTRARGRGGGKAEQPPRPEAAARAVRQSRSRENTALGNRARHGPSVGWRSVFDPGLWRQGLIAGPAGAVLMAIPACAVALVRDTTGHDWVDRGQAHGRRRYDRRWLRRGRRR